MRNYCRLIPLVLLFFCSCEFLGWDSSGGNNPEGDLHNTIDADSTGFFIEAPSGYPLNGSATILETESGDLIGISDINVSATSDLNSMTNEDALKIVQAACDETATTIDNIDVATDATISWTNQGAQSADLVLYNATQGTEIFRLIECLAL